MADQHRVRLIIDVPPELRRRVKVAAANQDTSVRRYVAAILDQAVPGSESPVTLQDVQRLGEVRARIMRGRRFEDDSTEILRQERERRSSGAPC